LVYVLGTGSRVGDLQTQLFRLQYT